MFLKGDIGSKMWQFLQVKGDTQNCCLGYPHTLCRKRFHTLPFGPHPFFLIRVAESSAVIENG